MAYTSHILDQVKTLGFCQATATSISLGIDDLLTIPSKGWLVQDAEHQNLILEKQHHYGNVHAVEKLRQSIEIWYATSEYFRQEMNPNFRMTDPFNPVHIMSFSGARGNASQVHQLVARKGVVDIVVRTSDVGYLTRRLVEVVQHIVVHRTDCGTIRGISVNTKNEMMPESSWIQTLIGRVLADDIYRGSRCIAVRNQDIGIGLLNRFKTFQTQLISIRTPFTCRNTSWICRLCYGQSPTHGHLVELGEAVGIIAGQSIGEPGTQLTLRTFHTGGVFTGGTAEQVRAPYNGKIQFNEDLVHPTRDITQGLPKVERGRSLEDLVCYRVLLLGITKTSLNTQSFKSEASFQETARVLSKATLRGRIDWLKGLKENVVLGGMMSVGTGFKRIIHRLK
ncbi:unnamed protein product [Sphenostylis stenocarpa]|uniref:DNA-directed RNA polymerase n=1 Tax=Sphenostylis stenocarpa TaxID=92480 RepID=A0AA86SGN0_9FABA|nr:unnamed protein product [Sphenostylis stenocarpa]